MGETSQSLIFPTKEDIVALNQIQIQDTGGFADGAGKLHNESSLEWVLEIIQHPLFGSQPYPTISAKAAILAWTIIQAHVFLDGNKRTGISAMMVFLRLNGFYLNVHEDEIVKVALQVANPREASYSSEMFANWVKNHISILNPPPY